MSPRISGGELTRQPASPLPAVFAGASPQQLAACEFVDSGSGNGILVAVAGSGKTTTLVEMCKRVQGQALFLAYNRNIAEEIGAKLVAAGVPRSVKASTFHSAGWQTWRNSNPKVKMDGDKLEKIAEELQIPPFLRGFVKKLVGLAKQDGAGIADAMELTSDLYYQGIVEHFDMEEMLINEFTEDPSQNVELGIEWAIKMLRRSLELNPVVADFDDMIYAPLYHRSNFWKYDWIFLDEAQDTNQTRRLMARAMLKKSGRLIAVGDPRQAIYGFTGANADSLDLIKRDFDCVELPLTVSFRCPKAVVEHARRWVSHIEAAPNAAEGEVRTLGYEAFMKLTPEPGDVILCRNTKPLIQLCLGYLKRKVPAHVEGRDLGQQLVSLVKKWKTPRTNYDLAERLREYLQDEVVRIRSKGGSEAKIQQLEDRVGSLLTIMATLRDDDTVEDVANYVMSLFKDSKGDPRPSITLSTVHKAKGREWSRVYLYGRTKFMPSPFATQVWQHEQEINLIYVAVTRSKSELIEVVVP